MRCVLLSQKIVLGVPCDVFGAVSFGEVIGRAGILHIHSSDATVIESLGMSKKVSCALENAVGCLRDIEA